MSSFIDRNPEKMIAYGKSAKEVIGNMVGLMKKIEGTLDACAADLDSASQREINKLHECIQQFQREITVYNDVADEIQKKGQRLKEVVEGHKAS